MPGLAADRPKPAATSAQSRRGYIWTPRP
jgi:hypothetical protein